MSVVVRMEMPKWCGGCPCVNGEYGYCQADAEERTIETTDGRPSWCPIICQLPEGHGRLIDADVFKENMDYVCDAGGWLEPVTSAVTEYVKKHIDAQAVIVPAEEPPKEDA